MSNIETTLYHLHKISDVDRRVDGDYFIPAENVSNIYDGLELDIHLAYKSTGVSYIDDKSTKYSLQEIEDKYVLSFLRYDLLDSLVKRALSEKDYSRTVYLVTARQFAQECFFELSGVFK